MLLNRKLLSLRALIATGLLLLNLNVVHADIPNLFGGVGDEDVVDVVVDSSGNVVVLGLFSDTISYPNPDYTGEEGDIEPVVLTITTGATERDLYLAKYDSSGNIIWVVQAGAGGDRQIDTLAIDSSDNLYISGYTEGAVNLFGVALSDQGFIAKINNADGALLWSRALGVTSSQSIQLTVAVDDSIFITDWNSTTFQQISSVDGTNISVAQNFTAGATNGTVIQSSRLAASSATELYVLATLSTPIDGQLCGDAMSLEALAARRFVLKYENTGSWVCRWISEVEIDGSEGVTGDIVVGNTNTDVFYADRGRVLRINHTDGEKKWLQQVENRDLIYKADINNATYPRGSEFTSLTVDSFGNSYLSGIYNGQLNLGAHSLAAAQVPTIFVARLSLAGDVDWVKSADRGTHLPVTADSLNAHIAINEATAKLYVSGKLTGLSKFSEEIGIGDRGLLTSTNAPTSDGGLEFDGTDDYLELPYTLLDGLTDLTIEMKIKIEPEFVGQWTLLSAAKEGQFADNEFAFLFGNGTDLGVIPHSQGSVNFILVSPINDGAWHHVSLARSITGTDATYTLYVDGVKQSDINGDCSTCTLPNNGPLQVSPGGLFIGQEQDAVGGSFDPNQAFEGRLDEVRIWNTAYAGGVPPTPTGQETNLVGMWDFDSPFFTLDSVGDSSLLDSSSNNIHLAWSLLPTGVRPKLVSGASPTANGALLFDGDDDYLVLPSAVLNAATDLTVDMKIKIETGATGTWSLLSAANNATDNDFLMIFDSSTKLTIIDNARYLYFTLDKPINDGAWHDIRLTRIYNSGLNAAGTAWITYELTIDDGGFDVSCLGTGDYRCSITWTLPGVSTNDVIDPDVNGLLFGQDQDVVGGAFNSSQAFEGQLDELKIWNTSTPPATGEVGLLAYWKFDDTDSAPTNNTVVQNLAYDLSWQGGAVDPIRLSLYEVPNSPADAYLALLDATDGRWIAGESWEIGQAISPPPGAILTIPEISIEGLTDIEAQSYFYWNDFENVLYVIRPAPGIVTINWHVTNVITSPLRISVTGILLNPRENLRQYHVADTSTQLEPATQLDDPGKPLRFYGVAYPNNFSIRNDVEKGPIFERSAPVGTQAEYIVLHYTRVNTSGEVADPLTQGSVFQTVYTIPWNDERVFEDNAACTIGTALADNRHNDPTMNGYVVNEKSFYDGVGSNRIHDRVNRTGPIIPVNKDTVGTDDDMVVTWFENNAIGQGWGVKPIRYNCEWPANPNTIVIAEQAGSGPLASNIINPVIYNQPDKLLSGFNPNEEHALLVPGTTGMEVFALRNDLNSVASFSEPYVLLKYQDSNNNNEWAIDVYKVDDHSDSRIFAPDPINLDEPLYRLQAGLLVQAPRPLINLPLCNADNEIAVDDGNIAWKDHKDFIWARAAGDVTLQYYYPLQEGFFYDIDGDGIQDDVPAGTCIPWLDRLVNGTEGTPVNILYEFNWPTAVPVLSPGETLFSSKEVACSAASAEACFLPQINGQAAVQIIFDEHTQDGVNDPADSLVKLIDPISQRRVALDTLPADIITVTRGGQKLFSKLPFHLRSRLTYDELNKQLNFVGSFDDSQVGDPHLLPNIMTTRERDRIKSLLEDSNVLEEAQAFRLAVDELYNQTRNPNNIDNGGNTSAYRVGLQELDGVVEPQALLDTPMMLTAGRAANEGYVTVAFNNDPSLDLPVSLQVMKVSCDSGVYQGNIWIVPTDNIFEEALTLRHSGDFAGDPDLLDFKWYYQADTAGQPAAPVGDISHPQYPNDAPVSPWILHPASGIGAVDVTIEGPGLLTLSDNWFVTRYTSVGASPDVCGNKGDTAVTPPVAAIPSQWAGDPASTPAKAMLAEGWIKRVISGLNPFDSRVSDFHTNEVNTLTSMIAQAGEPYSGPIPFNPDGDVINNLGLIEAYQTVLERGRQLSLDAGFNDVSVNAQLLNVSTRIADLYMLLGNEAYADAQDPTIGFDTGSELGSLASSIFTFQNQLATPLEEELALLRGRDDSNAGVAGFPIYNRLFWNFTEGSGEVAYAQSYAINDQNKDGFINETDARVLYPQGHGDAWGHYLTSTKLRYKLLQEPNFTWVPRAESVLVAGVPIKVDYFDERKFAWAAAAKARAGVEIVNLTYREKYVEAPSGQWQGYKDTDTARAWGLDGWGRRAAQGAYFDWLTVNAILPAEDLNPAHTGIDKVDRSTVKELAQLISGFSDIQAQVDKADAGINPIGVAKGAVPFDIDPNFLEVGSGLQGDNHFDQIAQRAQKALDNAVAVFDHASQQTQSLRNVQDDVNKLTQLVTEQERDYKNQLIEIFGYPYVGDIGGGKTYSSGYDGPDLYHYMYVSSNLTGDLPAPDKNLTGIYSPMEFAPGRYSFNFPEDLAFDESDIVSTQTVNINFPLATGADWDFVAPTNWLKRRAPGELQIAISDLLQAGSALGRAKLEHSNLLTKIEDAGDLLESEYDLQEQSITIMNNNLGTVKDFNAGLNAARAVQAVAETAAVVFQGMGDALKDSIPKVVGTSNDVFSNLRGIVGATYDGYATGLTRVAKVSELTAGGLELLKEEAALQTEINLFVDTPNIALIERVKELEQLVREEIVLRLEIYTQTEVVDQSMGRYQQVLAKGQRLMEERRAFRIATSGDTQSNRYRDMTFRIFRNDALQKYRAQFDLAARYVYLAATAYDYETNLLGSDNGAGRKFLADIVRQRSLGQVIDGVPVAGTPGLADVLARLVQNFDVYRGQLGFNNPQIETNRFSLRKELFRIRGDSDGAWRKKLEDSRVSNLWDIPEFKRYARPFAPESAGAQPGFVFRFPTTVTFGLNFFGHELGGGDSAYDPTNFATKIRAAGVWFTNYNGTALSNTPRIYLFPVGMDILRSPDDSQLKTREWRVVDQKLPPPFPLGQSDLDNPNWMPINDSLSDTFGDIRRFSSFRAFHDSGTFDESETASDTRLVGRSVWNTEWMMIIPGGSLLFDADEGLDRFINGQLVNSYGTERDGNGISDIRMFFQTYGFSGN